ncbi:F-box/LRR-repeat protein At4g14103-like [Aristolochia californica]|uniref:F-box/LRR-repeat protein At4g14103-like n=1 Tax=Aristolochia californica TaxID=171875 RepID=UPI0035E3B7E0
MGSATKKMRKLHPASLPGEADFITTLPEGILQHILSFVPTKTAVQASILSKTWRYHWVSVPYLYFDDDEIFSAGFSTDKLLWITDLRQISLNSVRAKAVWPRYTEFIDSVLLLRDGTTKLEKFTMRFRCLCFELIKFCYWITYAVKHEVEEIDLEVGLTGFSYKKSASLPQCVFSSQRLRSLRLSLRESFLFLPPVITFNHLKKLHLKAIYLVSQKGSFDIFYNCLVLEDLIMESCTFYNCFNVHISGDRLKRFVLINDWKCHHKFEIFLSAPNLLKLEYISRPNGIKSFSFSNLSSLVEAVIDLRIAQLLSNAPNTSISRSPPFENLKHLKIITCLYNTSYTHVLLSLFRCCPKLETLVIEKERPMEGPHQNRQELCECEMNCLREVEIVDFMERTNEVDFLEILLMNSPILEKLNVNFLKVRGKDHKKIINTFSKKLLAMPRASSTVAFVLT